jgi:undecaprenyl-phosphate galactose phosphotransferase
MPQVRFEEKLVLLRSIRRGVRDTIPRIPPPEYKITKNYLLSPAAQAVKRGFDIIGSLSALLLLAPVFLFFTVLVRCDGGPALFKQQRVGKDGKKFYCYKFRSMCLDAEAALPYYLSSNPETAAEWQMFQKIKNDIRITSVGRFIRPWHIDELPQLINVVKGDMSLVGPRPIIIGQEDFYGDDFTHYQSVRPGITGPWQISGRNKRTFEERVMLDSDYAKNWSFWQDIVILCKTFPTILQKEESF